MKPDRDCWMGDDSHTGRKVVIVSLQGRIRDCRQAAKKSREAYQQDYMRVPCEFYADAMDEAANLLQSRLETVVGYHGKQPLSEAGGSTQSEAPSTSHDAVPPAGQGEK